jgi:hypothetical protein
MPPCRFLRFRRFLRHIDALFSLRCRHYLRHIAAMIR